MTDTQPSIAGHTDRVTGRPATIYTPPEDLVPSRDVPGSGVARDVLALRTEALARVVAERDTARAEVERLEGARALLLRTLESALGHLDAVAVAIGLNLPDDDDGYRSDVVADCLLDHARGVMSRAEAAEAEVGTLRAKVAALQVAVSHSAESCADGPCEFHETVARAESAEAKVAAVEAHPVVLELAEERTRQTAKHGDQSHLPDGTGAALWLSMDDDYIRRHGIRRDNLAAWAKARTDEASQASGDGSITFEHILTEEWAEAIAESDPDALRAELVQVAAVAVQWIEAIDLRAALATTGEGEHVPNGGVAELQAVVKRQAEGAKA